MKMETWFATDQYVEKLFKSNHKEADTRMTLRALYKNANTVIVSKDTDVLILLVYMYALKTITLKWCKKIDNEKFTDVRKIVEYYGKDVILKLPHIHAVIGCDTMSYLHGVGKIKVFKKCVNSKENINLLLDIGVLSTINEKTVGKVSKFIQTMCYSGMEDESVTEKRVIIYKQLKTKTSHLIPLDENSMLHTIKRIYYQLYYIVRTPPPPFPPCL